MRISDPAPGPDVLVVGAGLAGLHIATLLARLGHDVTHYELAVDATRVFRLATAFDELKPAI